MKRGAHDSTVQYLDDALPELIFFRNTTNHREFNFFSLSAKL